MKGVATADKAPTKEQLDRIRELSQIVLGDPDALFANVGYPENTWQASAYLGALHKTRNKMKPLPGTERDIHKRITDLKNRGPHPAPVVLPPPTGPDAHDQEEPPMADTKTCRRCGQTKPADEDHFGADQRTHDGLGATCFECKSSQAKAAHRAKGDPVSKGTTEKKVASSVKSPKGPSETIPDRPSQADPPPIDGWVVLSDPRLSDLRKLQDLLATTATIDLALEEVAELATAIASTFGPEGSDDS